MSTIPELSPEACAEGVTGHWQLQRIVGELRAARDDWRTRNGRVSGEKGGRSPMIAVSPMTTPVP